MALSPRDRVRRTLRFEGVDRPARDVWPLPAAYFGREAELQALLDQYPSDFGPNGYRDPVDESPLYVPGEWRDPWGCVWRNIQPGMIGEVKQPAIADWSQLAHWQPPWHLLGRGFEDVNRTCAESDRFTMLGTPRPWERYQFVRGPENAYMDLAWGVPEARRLLAMIHDYNLRYLEHAAATDVDALVFMDDWGSEHALLISPAMWVEVFKPLYRDYVELAHSHDKFALMHSDGYIMDIYPHLIDIGVDAINSQLFIMPIEEIGARFKGQITFWGEMDRQHTMPFGTPDDVRADVARVRRALWDERGGFIAQLEVNRDVPLENLRAFFEAWWGGPDA